MKKKNKQMSKELIILRQIMVGEELREEEVQSLKEVVEEAVKAPPHKSKKKIEGKDEVGPNRT